MSTAKDGSKRSAATREKAPVSKTSTRKSSKEQGAKKSHEVKKQTIEKTSEEKDLTKKSTVSTGGLIKGKTANKPTNKIIQNISGPSKSSTSHKTSPVSKSVTNKPATSTSRITKSQYFPSKYLFSNALKSRDRESNLLEEDTDKKTTSKELQTKRVAPRASLIVKKPAGTNERVKRPLKSNNSSSGINETNKITVNKSEEIKTTSRDSSPETSSTWERPRTATLRKGSIVNDNIAGPEAQTLVKNIPVIKKNAVAQQGDRKSPVMSSSDDNNYEEDFDSYESDFEAVTSSDDTNLAVSSGEAVSSLTTSSAEDISDRKALSPIPMQRSGKLRLSSASTDSERKLDSGTFELSDFKHRQILKYIEDTVKKEDAILEQEHSRQKASHPSLSDEGFEDQKSLQFINFADAKRKCEKRRASAARKKRGTELLGMIKLDAVSFTIFDSPSVPYDVFITNYGKCNSVQASVQTGEDDMSEEVQTDDIKTETKWAQMPNTFSTFDQNKESFWRNYKFELLGAGSEDAGIFKNDEEPELNENRLAEFVRRTGDLILEVLSEKNFSNIRNLNENKNELPFSKGYLQFDTSEDIFRKSSIKSLSVHSTNVNRILSVHAKYDDDFIRSIVCVWEVSNFSAPRATLVSFGSVCCSSFISSSDKYVVAGQEDGALLIWQIEEKCKLYDIASRTPSFITPIGSNHFSKVISVQSVPRNQKNNTTDSLENNVIISLDEAGTIIIWTFYPDDVGRSVNHVVLITTQVINLTEIYPHLPDLLCSDFIISDDHVYVSCNHGFILHHLLRNSRTVIKKFVSDSKIEATCLESCPFSPYYFLAGYSNGDVSLFSRTTERPLLVLQSKEEIDTSGVQIVQWSKTKPFLFYTKDTVNTIHIWDLCKSDMYPEYSIPFPEKISSLKLSPILNREREESAYMLIGTESGELYLHLLHKDHGHGSFEAYQESVKIFLNYVNRL